MADSENTRTAPQCTTTRRAFLGSSAATLATLPTITLAAAPHPDAELLAAYADYITFAHNFNCAPDRGSKPEEERHADYERLCYLLDRLFGFTAQTPAGLATLALAALSQCPLFDDLRFLEPWDGYNRPKGIEHDDVARLLWNIVESGNQMALAAG